jgi:hypothetical protein
MGYEEICHEGIRLWVLVVEMSTSESVEFRRVQLFRALREVAQSSAMRAVALLAALLTAHLVSTPTQQGRWYPALSLSGREDGTR